MGSSVGVTTAPQGIFRSRAVTSNRQSENSGRGEVTRREETAAQVLTGPLSEAVKELTALTSICSARSSKSDRSSPSLIQVPPASRCPRPPGGAGPSDRRRNRSTSCHTRADPGDGSRARLSMFLSLRPLQPQKPYKQQLHPACGLTQDKTSRTGTSSQRASQRARDRKASLSGVESVLVMCRP